MKPPPFINRLTTNISVFVMACGCEQNTTAHELFMAPDWDINPNSRPGVNEKLYPPTEWRELDEWVIQQAKY